jgi:class 3 adenylate cyclase
MNDEPSQDLCLSNTDLITLVTSGRELAAEVNLRLLIPRMLEKATHLTNSTDGSVFLFDGNRNALYFAYAIGANAAMVLDQWGESSKQGIPLVGSKAGEVFASGNSICINALSNDQSHFVGVDEKTGHKTNSMVCVPMTAAGKRMGVMQILNKRDAPYERRDLVLLEYFAAQAAVAIRNALLFEDLLAHMGLYASRKYDTGPIELLEELTRPARTEDLSVLFADMRGFTQLCTIESRPERTQQFLNEFLCMLADAVLAKQGVVNKFLGDGLKALFRGTDHAIHAVECAADMLHHFDQLHNRWDKSSNTPLSFLDLGIGIATGAVILGSIGSDRVREFTAVGKAVNRAAHLMSEARDGRRLLIDKKTFQATNNLIESSDGPEKFELKKSTQSVGIPYVLYHVKRLKTGLSLSSQQVANSEQVVSESNGHVFISYSHIDVRWLNRMKSHLKPFERNGQLRIWDDTHIKTGRWSEYIQGALKDAKVAVLLVSPNFLNSDFIATIELPTILNLEKNRGCRVLWVPISACCYGDTDIAAYQAAHDPAKPLDTLSGGKRNNALVAVCEKIKEVFRDQEQKR